MFGLHGLNEHVQMIEKHCRPSFFRMVVIIKHVKHIKP